MDELIEFIEQYDEIQFIVSLDYSTDEADIYSCSEWQALYPELGEHGNSPLILDGDPAHHIWNMFAGSTYSAYAFIDHNMVLRYKFDMPNLYDFQYTYIPNLLDEMYGCTDASACNYNQDSVFDDESCQYGDECEQCDEAGNQLECMDIDGCIGMGDHCMAGSNCTDPLAFNYNPIADILGDGDNTACDYSPFINFGCTYENAINFDESANVDDGSCSHELIDINGDGLIDILDIILIVHIVIEG